MRLRLLVAAAAAALTLAAPTLAAPPSVGARAYLVANASKLEATAEDVDRLLERCGFLTQRTTE